jgi:hypothetical protein
LKNKKVNKMNARHYPEETKKIKALKKLIPIIVAILLMAIFTTSVKAQVTGTATGSATIITPISITKTVDMNFGSIAVGTTLGSVVLAPDNTRSKTGGVTLPAVTGTVTAAQFTVNGLGTSTFSITLPSSYTITNGSNTMNIDTFTSTPSGSGALVGGTQTVKVGATLHIAASQSAGAYTNGTGFPVIVNYN